MQRLWCGKDKIKYLSSVYHPLWMGTDFCEQSLTQIQALINTLDYTIARVTGKKFLFSADRLLVWPLNSNLYLDPRDV